MDHELLTKEAGVMDILRPMLPLSAGEAMARRSGALKNIEMTGNRYGIRHAPTTIQVGKDAKDTVLIELGKVAKDPAAMSEVGGMVNRTISNEGGIAAIIAKMNPSQKEVLREKLLTGIALGAGTTGAGLYVANKASDPKIVVKQSSVLDNVLGSATGILKAKKDGYINAWRNASKIKNSYAMKGAGGGAAVGAGAGYLETGDAKGALAGAAGGAALGYGGGHLVGSNVVRKVRGESIKAVAAVGAVGAASAAASKVLSTDGARRFAAKHGLGSMDKVIAKNDKLRNWFKGTKDDMVGALKSDGVEGAVAAGKGAVDKVQKNIAESGYGLTHSRTKGNVFASKHPTRFNKRTGEGYQMIVKDVKDSVTGAKRKGLVERPGKLEEGKFRRTGPDKLVKTSSFNKLMQKVASMLGELESPGKPDAVEKTAGLGKWIKNVAGSTVNPNYMVAPTAMKGAAGGALAGGVIGGASGGADGAWKGALGGAALGGGGGAYMGKQIGQGYSTFGRTLAGTAGFFGGKAGLNAAIKRYSGDPNFVGNTMKGGFEAFSKGMESGGFKGAWDSIKNFGKGTYDKMNTTVKADRLISNIKNVKVVKKGPLQNSIRVKPTAV